MKKVNHILIVLGFLAVAFTSCKKDPDSPAPAQPKVADEINKFIWSGLHDYYLWNEQVPYFTNQYYNDPKTADSLTNFLNKNTDHEKFFYSLLYDYGKTDKFSWIVDDYQELEKEFQGITKSMGYNFMLGLYGTEGKVLGYVRYVLKGSPADLAGVKRGDIFNMVNDQQLTKDNYRTLLLNSENYKLSFSDVINHTLVSNGKTATMTAIEINENPIFLDTVYNINNLKIGYLLYNGFTSPYDKQLNDVFLKFKNAGVNKLILDLRYNGGGSVETAAYLASMIHGTDETQIFLKTQYNNILTDYFLKEVGSDYFNINFALNIENADKSKTPINTLNLSDIYIIATDNTASASESIINGLKPYMNVVTIGTTTYGKYVGSITVKDYIDDRGTVNPAHKWAMQPIVLKIANASGVSDYVNGLDPNIEVEEKIENMSVLGNTEEPLLSAAISAITGTAKKMGVAPPTFKVQNLPEIKNLHRRTEMYLSHPKVSINFKK